MASKLHPDYLEIPELASNPSTPASGDARLFVKNDGTVNVILDDTTVIDLTAAGVTTLDALSDTNLSALADGQFLKYISPPGEWQNVAPVINDLDDVTVTTPSDGQALLYVQGSSEWQNGDIATTVDALTDTTITTPEQGDFLIRDGSDWKNLPYNPSAFAYLPTDTLTPLVIHSETAPNEGKHLLDLADSETLHESLASVGNLTVATNGNTDFRTPVGADNALGTLHGYIAFDSSNYFDYGTFTLYIDDIAIGDTPIAGQGILLWDGDPTDVYTPNGNVCVIPVIFPIYGGLVAGARRYPISIVNQGGDPFEITWRLSIDWHENQ